MLITVAAVAVVVMAAGEAAATGAAAGGTAAAATRAGTGPTDQLTVVGAGRERAPTRTAFGGGFCCPVWTAWAGWAVFSEGSRESYLEGGHKLRSSRGSFHSSP